MAITNQTRHDKNPRYIIPVSRANGYIREGFLSYPCPVCSRTVLQELPTGITPGMEIVVFPSCHADRPTRLWIGGIVDRARSGGVPG